MSAVVVEIARKPELEVEPEDVTGSLQSHNKTCNKWEVAYVWGKKVCVFFFFSEISWWRFCEDYWVITKYLEYYINLVDQAVAGFEKIDSNFENFIVGKMLSNSITCYRELIREMKSTWVSHILLLSYLKLPQIPQILAAVTLIIH